MAVLTYSQARATLADCLRSAIDDFEPIIIRRQNNTSAILVNYDEYRAMAETLHVLGAPKNAQRIRDSIKAVEHHKGLIHQTPEELGV